MAFFRSQGIKLVIYLDDILVMHTNKTILSQQLSFMRTWLEALGFVINLEKSQFNPS